MEAVITTDRRPTPEMIEEAKRLAEKFNITYVKRRHRTIESIKKEFGKSVLIVGKDLNLTLHTLSGKKLFFHPGLFKIRLLNYIATGHEAMIEAMNLKEGEQYLTATLDLPRMLCLRLLFQRGKFQGLKKIL